MGKFKDFAITEGLGLADLGPKMDKLISSKNFGDKIQGAYLSSKWSEIGNTSLDHGADNYSDRFGAEISVPSVERTGTITHLFKNKNPICIRLSDGTECYFTYDEYQRIQGTPGIGKTMTVKFQRSPNDLSDQASKIEKAIVR